MSIYTILYRASYDLFFTVLNLDINVVINVRPWQLDVFNLPEMELK